VHLIDKLSTDSLDGCIKERRKPISADEINCVWHEWRSDLTHLKIVDKIGATASYFFLSVQKYEIGRE